MKEEDLRDTKKSQNFRINDVGMLGERGNRCDYQFLVSIVG